MQRSRRKYQHIDFTPPQDVADTAALGLDLREQYGRGGNDIEVARARNLRRRSKLVLETIRQMVTYFRTNPDTPDENSAEPTDEYIQWLLHGGVPGQRWIERIFAQIEEVDSQHPYRRRTTSPS